MNVIVSAKRSLVKEKRDIFISATEASHASSQAHEERSSNEGIWLRYHARRKQQPQQSIYGRVHDELKSRSRSRSQCQRKRNKQ